MILLLLAFTALRVSSIVRLPRDALQIGSDNHPYLHYINVERMGAEWTQATRLSGSRWQRPIGPAAELRGSREFYFAGRGRPGSTGTRV